MYQKWETLQNICENNLAALIRISGQIINVENDRLRSDLVGLAGWWLEVACLMK
jgi:hypothetical protein